MGNKLLNSFHFLLKKVLLPSRHLHGMAAGGHIVKHPWFLDYFFFIKEVMPVWRRHKICFLFSLSILYTTLVYLSLMKVRLSIMTNYTHLCREQRDTIQYLLDKNYTLTSIGNAIKVDRTTVSKEIRRNRYLKSYTYDSFDKKGIDNAINACPNLSKYPFVCNFCKHKGGCRKNKLYYHSNIAQQHYELVLKTSREGIDIEPSVIDEIEQSIIPLIKDKKQSINQVYINHSDILYFTKPTFYKYVNLGVLSISNLDLPKKVKYKKRKHNRTNDNKRKIAILKDSYNKN